MVENLVLLGYVGALALAFLYAGMRLERVGPWVMAFLLAGFAGHTALLAFRWWSGGVIPATTLRDLCGAQAWVLLLLFLLLFVKLRNTVLTFFLTPVVTLAYLSSLIIPETRLELKPFFLTPWFVVHILLLLAGMGFFFLSFLYATIFIMHDHRLRHQKPPVRLPLPSLEEAGVWASRFLLWGYPLFTAGIFSSAFYGIRFAEREDWHPGLLEVSSLVSWVLLGIAVYGWFSAKVRPRKRSWLIVAGASFSVLIIVGILWH